MACLRNQTKVGEEPSCWAKQGKIDNLVRQYLNAELGEAKFNLDNLKAEFGKANLKS